MPLKALILTLNSVRCTQIYLSSSCDARLMYARMIDLTGFYINMRWAFNLIAFFPLANRLCRLHSIDISSID